MGTDTRNGIGPYHRGELEMQRLAGVSEEARRVGRILSPVLTDAAARLMAGHRLAVAASLDRDSWVWASLLTGPPGFLRPVDERLMLIESTPIPSDPLARNLAARSELGLLAIDLSTRRRMRFNGRGMIEPGRGIFLAIDQVYGNCPKYIQTRDVRWQSPGPDASPPRRTTELSDRQRALISAADTFFIASHHEEGGPDASHRGGAPGFVRFLDDRTLAFGDYAGNNMFNTLGNLVVQPRAGLLFPDFATGDTLQIRGITRLDRDPATVSSFRGAQGVVVTFEVEEVVETRGAGPRGRLIESSPVNP